MPPKWTNCSGSHSLQWYHAALHKMTDSNHEHIKENGMHVGKTLDWTYIEWHDEDMAKRTVDAHTQTSIEPAMDKETQTSNPFLMRIELSRTPSRLRCGSLCEVDAMPMPLFQFDRQAPARISTSPTLRRMRSTRLPCHDAGRIGSTQEEPGVSESPSPRSPLSPAHRQKSPLTAIVNQSNGDSDQNGHSNDLMTPGNMRSYRSKTISSTGLHLKQEFQNVNESADSGDDIEEVKYKMVKLWVYFLQKRVYCTPPLLLEECFGLWYARESDNGHLSRVYSLKSVTVNGGGHKCDFFLLLHNTSHREPLHSFQLKSPCSFCSASCGGSSQWALLTANESVDTCADSFDWAHVPRPPQADSSYGPSLPTGHRLWIMVGSVSDQKNERKTPFLQLMYSIRHILYSQNILADSRALRGTLKWHLSLLRCIYYQCAVMQKRHVLIGFSQSECTVIFIVTKLSSLLPVLTSYVFHCRWKSQVIKGRCTAPLSLAICMNYALLRFACVPHRISL